MCLVRSTGFDYNSVTEEFSIGDFFSGVSEKSAILGILNSQAGGVQVLVKEQRAAHPKRM